MAADIVICIIERRLRKPIVGENISRTGSGKEDGGQARMVLCAREVPGSDGEISWQPSVLIA